MAHTATLSLGCEDSSWRPACLQEAYLWLVLFKDAAVKEGQELGSDRMHLTGEEHSVGRDFPMNAIHPETGVYVDGKQRSL